MSKTIQIITRTAVLLALTVLFQSLRSLIPMPPNVSQYIIGSLVNSSLVVASVVVGIKGGIIIAVLTPLIAFLQGTYAFPILAPFIALGNICIVIVFGLIYDKNKYAAMVIGASAKFIVMYITIVKIALPLFIVPDLTGPQTTAVPIALSLQFSWPQLVTALLGGLIAIAILPNLVKILHVTE